MAVTRSSDWDGKASDAVGDRGTVCSTSSLEGPGQWYLIDFMGNEVAAAWYGLRHGFWSSDGSLRHWRLEASHTGRSDGEWVVLRVHDGDESLNGGFASASWELDAPRPQQSQQQQQQQQQQPEFFRFFRVIMTGKNSGGHDHLCLSGFELWGLVRRNEAWPAELAERTAQLEALGGVGAKVEAQYEGNPNSEVWCPGTITAITNGTASIKTDKYYLSNWSGAPPATIRARR